METSENSTIYLECRELDILLLLDKMSKKTTLSDYHEKITNPKYSKKSPSLETIKRMEKLLFENQNMENAVLVFKDNDLKMYMASYHPKLGFIVDEHLPSNEVSNMVRIKESFPYFFIKEIYFTYQV